MFGLIADFIASIISIVLPSYLSYKALRTNDPAQTHPWLIYFTILSLTLLAESWTLFIIGWVPFYSWFRLIFMLYLVLPQTQGAKVLYLDYLEPFIVGHESKIDQFIGEAHERLQQVGLGYLNILIEYLREKVLGQKSPQPHEANNAAYGSYVQDLLSRFAMPGARTNTPTQPGTTSVGWYSMASNIAGAAFAGPQGGSSSRSVATDAANIPASLFSNIPGDSSAEKSTFIQSQRDRLSQLMKALDNEQQNLDLAYGSASGQQRPSSSGGGLKTKTKSEQSFDHVDYDDATRTPGTGSSSHDSTPPKLATGARRTTSGGWMPTGVTSWFGTGAEASGRNNDEQEARASKGWSAARNITEELARGISSGVDRH